MQISSIWSAGTPDRSMAAWPAVIARSRAGTSFRLPMNLPIAVRAALTNTTSFVSMDPIPVAGFLRRRVRLQVRSTGGCAWRTRTGRAAPASGGGARRDDPRHGGVRARPYRDGAAMPAAAPAGPDRLRQRPAGGGMPAGRAGRQLLDHGR